MKRKGGRMAETARRMNHTTAAKQKKRKKEMITRTTQRMMTKTRPRKSDARMLTRAKAARKFN
jgi:hypothetical protein